MPKKRRIIPFWLLPASWGLAGTVREEAEAFYYLSGEELDRRLADIRYPDDSEEKQKLNCEIDYKYNKISLYDRDLNIAKIESKTPEDLARKINHINFMHCKIDGYQYDIKNAELDHPEGKERDLALLEVEYSMKKIDKNGYEKAKATIENQPWIGIVDHGFDATQGINGVFFEFDWNDQWIEYLRLNGYVGTSDDQMVEQWFSDVCRMQMISDMSEEEMFAYRTR